jgi:DNA repair exonuclease SbcCD nuclease subunit
MNDKLATLLMVGDVHISDRPPSTRTASYRDDILKKLLEIGAMATIEKVDAVVFVGDIFHSKKPVKTSHQTVRVVAAILGGYPAPVYILPGNHDYAGRHHENLSRHPLGTVALMPNITLFGTDERRSVMVSDPFESCEVRLIGVREEDDLEAFRFGNDEGIDGPTVIVAHSAIFPPGDVPTVWDAWDATEVREQFTDKVPAHVWYGHIHEPHGTYEVDGVPFTNLGAISRGSLHEEGARLRTPEVGVLSVWSDGDTDVTVYSLRSARAAEEVFRIEEVDSERAEASELNAFAEALSEVDIEVFSVENAISKLSEHPDAPEPVKARAIELIEEVS